MTDSVLYRKVYGIDRREERRSDGRMISALAAIVFVFVLFRILFAAISVIGSSMLPTLRDGDFLLAERYRTPVRGDVVILQVPKELASQFSGEYLVKRVVATEGDRLFAQGGVLWVCPAGETEFVAQEEDYLGSDTPDIPLTSVGEGELYCLGDNRGISKDSSEVGCFRRLDVYGTVPEWELALKEWFGSLRTLFPFGRYSNEKSSR